MSTIELRLLGDGLLEQERARAIDVYHLGNEAPPVIFTGREKATVGGKPAVVLGIRLDGDGRRLVVVELTLALFLAAADALDVRFGDPWK